jgi:N-formylglutamate amidohydrolase
MSYDCERPLYVRPGVFMRYDPLTTPVPVVFDVPRSGTDYPKDFRASAPFEALHAAVSMYVEELYGGAPAAGATLFYACFPNTYIDANRSVLDIDESLLDAPWPTPLQPTEKSRLGLGLIRKLVKGGVPVYTRKLAVAEVQARIANYYEPYHRALGTRLAHYRQEYGTTWHLSCHCMSSVGNEMALDRGKPRPDFCIGDRDGTTCARDFVDLVVDTLRSFGYAVTVNDPYKGAESIRKHGDPARGVHSLQIEMNKRLYMDEQTFCTTPDFAQVKAHLDRLAVAVADFTRTATG